MTHKHGFAYKKISTCSVLTKEGEDIICTETIKHYYNDKGLIKLKKMAQRQKDAVNAYDKKVMIDNADSILLEIIAVE